MGPQIRQAQGLLTHLQQAQQPMANREITDLLALALIYPVRDELLKLALSVEHGQRAVLRIGNLQTGVHDLAQQRDAIPRCGESPRQVRDQRELAPELIQLRLEPRLRRVTIGFFWSSSHIDCTGFSGDVGWGSTFAPTRARRNAIARMIGSAYASLRIYPNLRLPAISAGQHRRAHAAGRAVAADGVRIRND